jgi:hypothetical protein
VFRVEFDGNFGAHGTSLFVVMVIACPVLPNSRDHHQRTWLHPICI